MVKRETTSTRQKAIKGLGFGVVIFGLVLVILIIYSVIAGYK
jgi:hypothetical protein